MSDYKTGAEWACNHFSWSERIEVTGDPESWTTNPPASVGWICPKCGAGIAPWVSRCPCQDKWEVTC